MDTSDSRDPFSPEKYLVVDPTSHGLFLIILSQLKYFWGLGHSWYLCDQIYMKIGPK